MEKFWTHDLKELFKLEFIPKCEMSNNGKLNALSRLTILIGLISIKFRPEYTLAIFLTGFAIILLIRNSECKKEGFRPLRGRPDPCNNCGMPSHMSYINVKYETSPQNQYTHTIGDLRSWTTSKYNMKPVETPQPFRQVWRNEPKFCREFSLTPQSYTMVDDEEIANRPMKKCFHADRDFIDNLPKVTKCDNRKHNVMPAVQSAFMRDSLEFRNNIMGEYVNIFAKERQHGCAEFKPGRKTF